MKRHAFKEREKTDNQKKKKKKTPSGCTLTKTSHAGSSFGRIRSCREVDSPPEAEAGPPIGPRFSDARIESSAKPQLHSTTNDESQRRSHDSALRHIHETQTSLPCAVNGTLLQSIRRPPTHPAHDLQSERIKNKTT